MCDRATPPLRAADDLNRLFASLNEMRRGRNVSISLQTGRRTTILVGGDNVLINSDPAHLVAAVRRAIGELEGAL